MEGGRVRGRERREDGDRGSEREGLGIGGREGRQ